MSHSRHEAEIITIGDELLIGQVINTNQAYIAEKLNGAGVMISRMTTVGDEIDPLLAAFTEAWLRNRFVIVTGGLGPTHDDITKKAVCTFFGTELVKSDEVKRQIEELLKRRNAPWSEASEEQTLVPASARLFRNPLGTAAGMLFEEGDRSFIVLPGVPYEMKAIMDESVTPYLTSKITGSVIRHLTLRTAGISESALAKLLGDPVELLEGQRLAYLPAPTGVRLRITVQDTTAGSADGKVRSIEERIRQRAGKYIFGTGDGELEEALGKILASRKLTIAVAESCTGGLIAHRLTNVSGSSAYVERAVVAYSNTAKSALLGVSPDLIREHGAVSRQVAEAMATGVRRTAGTNIGLSTTGIAGPTGGSPEKPVGLVWIGFADDSTAFAMRFQFGEDRLLIKERAAQAALELVRRKVLNIE